MINPQIQSQFDQIWGTKTPVAGAPSTSRANDIRNLAPTGDAAPIDTSPFSMDNGPASVFANTPKAQAAREASRFGPKIIENISNDFATRRQSIQEADKAYAEGKQGLGETVVTHAGNIIGGAGDLAGETVLKPVTVLLGAVAGPIIDKVGGWGAGKTAEPLNIMHETSSKLALQSADTAHQAMNETNPQKKQNLIDLSKQQYAASQEATKAAQSYTDQLARGRRQAEVVRDVAPWILAGAKAETTFDNIKGSIEKGRAAAGDIVNKMTPDSPVSPTGPTTVVPPIVDNTSSAIKDVTPSYSKGLIGEPPVQTEGGSTPRINEGGLIKGRTVTSTPSEIQAGNELSKTASYNPKGTNLEKFNAVQGEIATRGQALEQSLKDENVLRPPKEISKLVKDAVNTASEDSLLLQKTDPIVKNYVRVANRAISQSDGTLGGELAVRKALDQAYEDAGGKYGNNKGLDQIHRAARNALNDDMEAKAQNTQVKDSLKSQSNLYKAADVLQDKAKLEGGSDLERFMKAHPLITKGAKAVGRAVGIGEAVHVAAP